MDANKEIRLFELQIDHESTVYLGEAAKWARFLSVLGFIWCGIIVMIGLSQMLRSGYSAFSSGYSMGYALAYIVLAILFFFPCLYLLSFAKKVRIALQSNDQEQLNGGLRSLKASFRFMGIMAIVWLSLVALTVVFIALISR